MLSSSRALARIAQVQSHLTSCATTGESLSPPAPCLCASACAATGASSCGCCASSSSCSSSSCSSSSCSSSSCTSSSCSSSSCSCPPSCSCSCCSTAPTRSPRAVFRDWNPEPLAFREIEDALRDPLLVVERWLATARADTRILQPDMLALATASADGAPSVRFVLIKDVSRALGGITFFTNYNSRKAAQLTVNARAAATLYWSQLNRQIRLEGSVQRLSDADSDAYFARRPRASQLGAWASPQSEPVVDREALVQRVAAVEERFRHVESIPRPPFWGGYLLVPTMVEFWQSGPGRLHDRFELRRSSADGRWAVKQLAP